MAYPEGIGAIDLMIGFPFRDKKAVYEYLQGGIKAWIEAGGEIEPPKEG